MSKTILAAAVAAAFALSATAAVACPFNAAEQGSDSNKVASSNSSPQGQGGSTTRTN